MYDETKPCSKTDFLRSLPFNIPFFGPQFLPPLYAVLGKRQTSTVKPELAYLKPVNVVHPFYYPMLAKCPESQSLDVKWDGWMGTGSCKVHGWNERRQPLGINCGAISVKHSPAERLTALPQQTCSSGKQTALGDSTYEYTSWNGKGWTHTQCRWHPILLMSLSISDLVVEENDGVCFLCLDCLNND